MRSVRIELTTSRLFDKGGTPFFYESDALTNWANFAAVNLCK